MKAIEGNYQNDQPAGIWNWWDENGKRTDSRNYELEGTSPEEPDVEPLDLDEAKPPEQPVVTPDRPDRPAADKQEPGNATPPAELKPGESPLPTEEVMEEIPLELPPAPKKDG